MGGVVAVARCTAGPRQDEHDRPAGGNSSAQDDNAFSGRVGLLYLFDNGIAPYVSYLSSFQPVPGTDFAGAAFKPTTGRQTEIGIKYQPSTYNALFTLAAFNLEQSNVPTVDPLNPLFNIQTGKIRSRGFEASAKATLDNGLSLVAAYTYLNSTVLVGNEENEGNTPLYTPRNAAAVWADYAFNSAPLNGLSLGGGVRYVGATYGNDANTLQIPPTRWSTSRCATTCPASGPA